MLYNLALQKKSPAIFGKFSKGGVPYAGIIFSGICLLVGVVLNYLVPAEVFVYATSVATFGAIYVWALILIVQLQFRKSLNPEQLSQVAYKTPWSPISNWIVMAFLALVLVMMAFNPGTRVALYVGPIWFILLIGFYYLSGMNHENTRDIKG